MSGSSADAISSVVIESEYSCQDMSGLSADDAISSVVIEFEYSCRCFSLAEIQSITNNFNEELVIGMGGFGKVYKGFIDNGATAVAIKRLKAESNQGAQEFWNEVKMLSKLRHTHLVSLIGQCNDCQEMILVYEYMARGTLADHLYKTSRNQTKISTFHLTWERRLNICIGAARGLDYLHTGTDQSFIHRDVKTTNILLDENCVAKISDFGLSKGSTSNSATHVSTKVKGTFGYFDPVYFYTQRLTKKSDVYAFGVVLLEVLCGRPPVDTRLEEEEISLILWAQRHIKKGKVDRIIDPSLIGQITPQSLKYFVEVAYNCLHTGSKERPTMAEVVGTLDLALLSQRKGQSRGIIGKVLQGIATVPKGMNHWWWERKENGFKSGPSNDSFWEPLPDSVTRQLRRFSLADIRAATNDFSEDRLIGKGCLCKVYKGYLDGETGIVAIKRFKELKSLQLWEEARVEIEVHSLLDSHPHIVSLIGFYNEKPELIGVYDYMTNGSLEDHLFNINSDPPLWKERLKICIGVARGLQHLHSSVKHRVIHCNVKPANILLDENWVAKVTDFAISKLIPNDVAYESITVSRICGTYGYMAPEYAIHGKLTTKSDVYSFGMVLLELLCAKKLRTFSLYEGDECPLDHWSKSSCKRGTIDQVIDPYLIGKIAPECFKEFVKIALSCILFQVIQRPSMDDVVTSLQLALQLQETWETCIEIGVELSMTEPSSYNVFSIDELSNNVFSIDEPSNIVFSIDELSHSDTYDVLTLNNVFCIDELSHSDTDDVPTLNSDV
ncbi:probable LRR receptor-like serine/threonine-protein kinase At5g65240 isoform X2 [Camellia sinensis]|uniref:probable LRR receptor-like serine/threonine-protein kinase At5g65240 isoform X2 n=1 Tax=Camellia sinensis TaxID=4442 RepID=UPI0010365085|nr:probable LRR receptor-like serine/threonine-protein kinase At5g65240 isoform X2 [Camellia sinensis]